MSIQSNISKMIKDADVIHEMEDELPLIEGIPKIPDPYFGSTIAEIQKRNLTGNLNNKETSRPFTFLRYTDEMIHEEYLNFLSHDDSLSTVHLEDDPDQCTCEKCYAEWWKTVVAPPHVEEVLDRLFSQNIGDT